MDTRKTAFILIFAALGLLLLQVNFSHILGTDNKSFTFFQFIGPIGGAILGPLGGVLAVLGVGISAFLLNGGELGIPLIVSLCTMSAAAIYFGSGRGSPVLAIPIAAMLLFWLHPSGAASWFYALYWLIPIGASLLRENVLARSLGATFTAHAIGSVAYLYAFNLPSELFVTLIPVVAYERLLFALGIAASYYVVTSVLSRFSSRVDLSFLNIERKYALFRAKDGS